MLYEKQYFLYVYSSFTLIHSVTISHAKHLRKRVTDYLSHYLDKC